MYKAYKLAIAASLRPDALLRLRLEGLRAESMRRLSMLGDGDVMATSKYLGTSDPWAG